MCPSHKHCHQPSDADFHRSSAARQPSAVLRRSGPNLQEPISDNVQELRRRRVQTPDEARLFDTIKHGPRPRNVLRRCSPEPRLRGVGATRLLSAGRVRLILIDRLSARPRGPFRAANLRRPPGRHSNHIQPLFLHRRGSAPSRVPGDHSSVGSRPSDDFSSASRFQPRRPQASAGALDSILQLFSGKPCFGLPITF